MPKWKVVFTSYGTTGRPQKATESYKSKEIAEEHANFFHKILKSDADYAGFTAFITPPPGEGKPYRYIHDIKRRKR